MLRTHWELLWEHIENQKTSKNPTRSSKEEYLWSTVVSDFTNFFNVHGNEPSPSATIQDMECSNLLVCEWVIVWTNIIIRVCQRKEEVSFRGQGNLPCTSFSPGTWYFTHFLLGTPYRLDTVFFPTGEKWTGYWGGVGFCGFLLFPSSFHFVLIKFAMGSPTCSESDLTLSYMLCPTSSFWWACVPLVFSLFSNFILLELGENIGVICLKWILLYWGSFQSLLNCLPWANQRDSCKIKSWTWNAQWTNY
jgi:hypothetical protein